MNPNKESTLHLMDISRLFSKYWALLLISTVIGTGAGIFATRYIPKKYKAQFVITIYSKYFQSPLIGDFMPGLSESNEMRSQREALIRQILTAEFLDALGHKYAIYDAGKNNWFMRTVNKIGRALGLFSEVREESVLSAQRKAMRQRIEIYSINNTTFNIGFLYSDPEITLKVTQDIHTQLIHSLLDIRSRLIGNVRMAIQSRLGSLRPSPVSRSVQPTEEQFIAQELAEVRRELQSLTAQYTDEHPLVMQLRDRERILASRLGAAPRSQKTGSGFIDQPLVGTSESGRDMYGDLVKKMNYLDIALDTDRRYQSDYFAILEAPLYPAEPLWPKKGLIAIWGAALGFFGVLFAVALKEYFERSAVHTDTIAHHLNLPILGELPAFPGKIRHS